MAAAHAVAHLHRDRAERPGPAAGRVLGTGRAYPADPAVCSFLFNPPNCAQSCGLRPPGDRFGELGWPLCRSLHKHYSHHLPTVLIRKWLSDLLDAVTILIKTPAICADF